MKRARGFTLVEILVALTLFAVVGGSLLQLFQSGLRTARLASEQTHAVLLARSKLAELQAYTHHQAGVSAGRLQDGYRWQAVLSPKADIEDTTRTRLKPLDLVLTISWGRAGEERRFSLQSLLLTRQVDS